MLGELQSLTLEVKYLDRVQAFYEAFLDLEVRRETDREVALAAGDTDLVLRAPGDPPRGGLHTHYACAIPEGRYDAWHDRLDQQFDLVEHTAGETRSLYFYDPAGNCIELSQRAVEGPGIDGPFRFAMEVADIDRALSFYDGLGFETVKRDDDRGRAHLTTGQFDVELREPQLGLADARAGVHVAFAVSVSDPEAVVDSVRDDALAVETTGDGLQVRDPDGHVVTLLED